MSWHSAALAHADRGQPVRALAAARRALAGADPNSAEAAEVRLLLAWIEQERGNLDTALGHLDLAQPRLSGALLARARCLRGLCRYLAGEHTVALRELTAAAAGSRRHGDARWLANAYNGRGVLRGETLALAAAERDLVRAQEIYAGLGEAERVAWCRHNRGFVALQAGDIPAALRLFEAAGLDVHSRPEALIDRAYALLAGGLIVEAGEVLGTAAELLDSAGRGLRLAEASLALGHCAARAGRTDLALGSARRARALFQAHGREGWLAAAAGLVLLLSGGSAAELVATADQCARHGLRVEAAELRLAVTEPTRALLEQVTAARTGGPVRLRAMGWLARARLAALEGNRRAVLAACRAGLRVVDQHAATFGALELRAGAAELAASLARTGLGEALAAGRPAGVLRWTERYRAAALRTGRIRPPRDPALAAGLVELRAAEARRAGLTTLAALENRVRTVALSARGEPMATSPFALTELTEHLGGTALLSFIEHDGSLVAVSVVDGRARLHRLDAAPDRVRADVQALRFTLGRAVAHRLDAALLAPLCHVLGDRSLVVVPAGGLSGLPWAALPGCSGRPVSVAPSAAAWLRAAQSMSTVDNRVWVGGPGLRHAEREVAGLHRRWGGVLLTGRDAAVDTVLTAMDGASLVHIAAHGRHREDAPLFSCLELADGPLYGYDLDRLSTAPHHLVLSACEGALATDELIGLATVLLRRGTKAVIASLTPVPDDAVVDLVTTLHEHLGAGAGPAEALARAQTRHGHHGFICLGAG
jgi:tetratricopeptide (TPR) repeat protein